MEKARIEVIEVVISDVKNGFRQAGDLYLPAENTEHSRPAVILLFGGGWRMGERAQQKAYGLGLAKAGYVCLAIDYRLSQDAQWPAQLEDVLTAIRWLRSHAAEFNIDKDLIAVSGNSSGGHLALMAAASNEASLKAVCAFYPPTILVGLDEFTQDTTVQSLMGGEVAREALEQASPLFHASRPFPPTLLISGARDTRVPIEHTYRMHQALEAAGNTVELHVFAGQGHAFDMERDMAYAALALMVNFFGRYLSKVPDKDGVISV